MHKNIIKTLVGNEQLIPADQTVIDLVVIALAQKDKQIKELTQDISIDNEIDKQLTLFPQKQNSK